MVVVRGTKRWKDPVKDLEVLMSKQAQKLVGADVLTGFVEDLLTFMETAGFTWAYVGKEGSSIRVNFGRRRT